MPPHQERVVTEKAELDAKLRKLRVFIDGAVFSGLHYDEQDRLQRQAKAMQEYSNILEERIVAFSDPTTPSARPFAVPKDREHDVY